MNIFFLSKDPQECAHQHCDKHVVKMVIETAQLLSTAHRLLDGTEWTDRTANNRRIKRWRLDSDLDDVLYKASHINHPDNIWVRDSKTNYEWTYDFFHQLCLEFTRRYQKEHLTYQKLDKVLNRVPTNLQDKPWVDPPQCMPDYCKTSNTVEAYRNYYRNEKQAFARWDRLNNTPEWMYV